LSAVATDRLGPVGKPPIVVEQRRFPRLVANGSDLGAQKLRGGYYTPSAIAEVLSEWAIVNPDGLVLEPSCGDGVFVEAAARRLSSVGHITAVELFASEAAKTAARSNGKATVITGDFFTWHLAHGAPSSFDAVVGNPPFIRYQSFPEEHREAAFSVMRSEGLRPSRLTNAWLPYVVAGTRSLKPGGRLALVLPAELLQVGYAGQLREYLARNYESLTIATFRSLIFSGIQQETVLLAGVRGQGTTARVHWVELENETELSAGQLEPRDGVVVDLNHAREKWTRYYLDARELELVRRIERSGALTNLGELADIDVGIVTGQNDFFVLSEADATLRGLKKSCLPLVSRSAQIPGVVLRRADWAKLTANGYRTLLLQLGPVDRDKLSAKALTYVRAGEELGYHEGFKCRIRQPRWWNVPSVWIPDGFLLRQIHDGPRVVANAAKVTCTDTIHRVRTHKGVDIRSVAYASVNSLTFAFAELYGRSYGGGVLELEPREAESLPYPKPSRVTAESLREVDSLIRRRETVAALSLVDSQLLTQSGFAADEIATLRGVWQKLFRRRLGRKER